MITLLRSIANVYSRSIQLVTIALLIPTVAAGKQSAADANSASKASQVFQKYCSSCHNDNEAEADVSLTSLSKILDLKSVDDKRLVVASKPDESLILQLMLGTAQPKMPPEEDPQPSADDIAAVRAWIAAGASPTMENAWLDKGNGSVQAHAKSTQVTAAALIGSNRIALGRLGRIEITSADNLEAIATVDGLLGKVSSLRVSSDGKLLVIGSGRVGVEGQISIVDLSSLKIVDQWSGHNDLVYCAALSPDGQWLASGSYDRKVIIWNVASGKSHAVLTSHNGPIFDLDFSPDGKTLATASGDQTIKLWNVPDGTRLDTLGQPEAEMRCVRFSSDGKYLYGAGADRQVRQWLVDPTATTGSPMLISRFAHDRELLRLELDREKVITASADGTVKLWTARDLLPLGEIAKTQSIPVAICLNGSTNPIVAELAGAVQSVSSELIAKRLASVTSANGQEALGETVSSHQWGSGAQPGVIEKITEIEPNNSVQVAQRIGLPVEISGVLSAQEGNIASLGKSASQESDLFKFAARAGESWAIELFAASEKSTLDAKIDILDSNGNPVLRTRLQAVRESYFTFRGKDSATIDDFRMHKWEDMELDEYLYSGGEVTRLWLYPRGPDSGFKVYPGAGSRYTFFGTTAISHPLGESAYIVRPLRADETPLPNGLPVFPIYFENDDDPLREHGPDPRLTFVAPFDGEYTLRIRDARGFVGSDYKYRAVIRRLQPEFSLSLGSKDLTAAINSGVEWSIKTKRLDGMEAAIAITLHGLPDGVLATNPLIIEASQLSALGALYVSSDVKPRKEPIEIRLTAKTIPVDGSDPIEKEIAERIRLTIDDSKVPQIVLLPNQADGRQIADQELSELTIKPGQTISARLRVDRNGVEGGIGFGKEDSGRNLPHGCFVDNIGLNGLLIVEGQSEREFFITAAPKVKPGKYQFHFRSETKGNPTSKPISLVVLP